MCQRHTPHRPSCESTQNPHGVDGCLKTATTYPTKTLSGHRRFRPQLGTTCLPALATPTLACAVAPPAGASLGCSPDPLSSPWGAPHSPTTGVVRARRAGSLPGGPKTTPVVCPGGAYRRIFPNRLAGWFRLCLAGSLRAAGACAPPAARPHLMRRWPWRVGLASRRLVWGAGCTRHGRVGSR